MNVPCIKCGKTTEETNITVAADTGLIHCDDCGADYTAADVRAAFAAWGPILAWAEAHPALKVKAVA